MQLYTNQTQQQLYQKWIALKAIPCDEQSFLKMESVFYDILIVARLQESSQIKERLLSQLTRLKNEKFQLTQKVYPKARQRELFICQFKTALNKEIAAYLRSAKTKANSERAVRAV